LKKEIILETRSLLYSSMSLFIKGKTYLKSSCFFFSWISYKLSRNLFKR